MITVQATQTGYYTHLRRVGEVFEINDEVHFSKRWMRKVGTTELIVIATKGRFDGPIWRNPGARFTIPNERALSENVMRVEGKAPSKSRGLK